MSLVEIAGQSGGRRPLGGKFPDRSTLLVSSSATVAPRSPDLPYGSGHVTHQNVTLDELGQMGVS
jgi:hypothetical protein